MRAEEASEEIDCSAVVVASGVDGGSETMRLEHLESGYGQRLCAAREVHGWTRQEAAARLKLPSSLIARLEGDNYEGLTHGVFLRGYLESYARLLGLPIDEAQRVAAAHTHTAPLIATGTISRSRYLFDRYSVSATYLVLTAIIVVPAVWLATHGGLEQNLARTTPLDPPAFVSGTQGAQDATLSAADSSEAGAGMEGASTLLSPLAIPSLALPAQEPAAVTASMTPFVASRSPVVEAPAAAEASVSGSGAHSLVLKLAQQSWVEVTAADGRKLEYSMLAADSEHTYRSDGPISVRLGNVQGAQLIADGRAVELSSFQRGNVAHVRVFADDGAGVSRVEQ